MLEKMKNMVFLTSGDLESFVRNDLNYFSFTIAESISLKGDEISDLLDPDTNYLAHSNFEGTLVLITSDYSFDCKKRYRPLLICEIDDNNGNLNVVQKLF